MFTTAGSPFTLPELGENVHAALKLWQKDDSEASPLQALFLYRAARRKTTSSRQATNDVLHEGLEVLATRYPMHARVLRLRFLDGKTAYVVANQLNVAESTVYALQKEALDRLAESLWALEQQARAAEQSKLLARLEPPSYLELVGADEHLDRLASTLLAPGPPWLVSVEGLGGAGKTSLADALMRHLISLAAFDDFGWVTARQMAFLGGGIRPVARPTLTADALIEALLAQLVGDPPLAGVLSPEQALAALHDRLQRPHLVVVDNLETVQDVEALLPALRRLAGPSKFVLTSRNSLFFEPGVRHFVIPELSEPDALRLVRLEASLRSLSDLESSSDQVLRPIYAAVGGNPLALRLVVGQVHTYSLEGVLADLASARGKKAEDLFTYVYRRAWECLDKMSRTVFAMMPAFAEHGCTAEDLAGAIDLDQSVVHDALETLVALNLVDCRGDLHAKRFTIHNLTRRFLEHQVLRWH